MFNEQSLDDFYGFSPSQMHQIIYFPFGKNCPIKISKQINDNYLNLSPIFNIAYYLTRLINDSNGIKLTPRGNLPVKVIKSVYEQRFFPDKIFDDGKFKLRSETDWLILHSTHILLKLSGILRKYNTKLLLTQKGKKLLTKSTKSVFFISLLENYSMKFNWAYNDDFEIEDIGQVGFLYLLFLVNQTDGNFKDLTYFSDLYLKAFPIFNSELKSGSSNITKPKIVLYSRFFERFALWFGFIEYNNNYKKMYLRNKIKIRKTKLLGVLLN